MIWLGPISQGDGLPFFQMYRWRKPGIGITWLSLLPRTSFREEEANIPKMCLAMHLSRQCCSRNFKLKILNLGVHIWPFSEKGVWDTSRSLLLLPRVWGQGQRTGKEPSSEVSCFLRDHSLLHISEQDKKNWKAVFPKWLLPFKALGISSYAPC